MNLSSIFRRRHRGGRRTRWNRSAAVWQHLDALILPTPEKRPLTVLRADRLRPARQCPLSLVLQTSIPGKRRNSRREDRPSSYLFTTSYMNPCWSFPAMNAIFQCNPSQDAHSGIFCRVTPGCDHRQRRVWPRGRNLTRMSSSMHRYTQGKARWTPMHQFALCW